MTDRVWSRTDLERSEDGAESRNERAKRRISECMEVNRLTFEGLSVTLIAQRLSLSRHKVRVLQCWLGWRTSSMKWAIGNRSDSDRAPHAKTAKRGSTWMLKYPDEASDGA